MIHKAPILLAVYSKINSEWFAIINSMTEQLPRAVEKLAD